MTAYISSHSRKIFRYEKWLQSFVCEISRVNIFAWLISDSTTRYTVENLSSPILFAQSDGQQFTSSLHFSVWASCDLRIVFVRFRRRLHFQYVRDVRESTTKIWQTHRHVCWRRCWSWNQVSWGWIASWCWKDSSSVWTVVPEVGRSWHVPGWHHRFGNCRLDLSRETAGAEPPIDPPPRRDAWWHFADLNFLPDVVLTATFGFGHGFVVLPLLKTRSILCVYVCVCVGARVFLFF